jgi:hypothetical protein
VSRRGRDKRNWQKLVALHLEGAGVAVVPAAGADLPSDTATGVEAGVPQDLMPDHVHHALGVELEDKAMLLQVMILKSRRYLRLFCAIYPSPVGSFNCCRLFLIWLIY